MNSNSTTIEKGQCDFQDDLEALSKQDDIAGHVAREALNYSSLEGFFNDLANYGCISGMIPSLIYYNDTHKFFDTHYEEIQALKDEWECGICESLSIEWDIKNFLAWFAFEEIAYKLASEWEGV